MCTEHGGKSIWHRKSEQPVSEIKKPEIEPYNQATQTASKIEENMLAENNMQRDTTQKNMIEHEPI